MLRGTLKRIGTTRRGIIRLIRMAMRRLLTTMKRHLSTTSMTEANKEVDINRNSTKSLSLAPK